MKDTTNDKDKQLEKISQPPVVSNQDSNRGLYAYKTVFSLKELGNSKFLKQVEVVFTTPYRFEDTGQVSFERHAIEDSAWQAFFLWCDNHPEDKEISRFTYWMLDASDNKFQEVSPVNIVVTEVKEDM